MSTMKDAVVVYYKATENGAEVYGFKFAEPNPFGGMFGGDDHWFASLEAAKQWFKDDRGWGSHNDIGDSGLEWVEVERESVGDVWVADGEPESVIRSPTR